MGVAFYYSWVSPPADFPAGKTLRVENGSSAQAVAEFLAEEDIVRSPFFLRALIYLTGRAGNVAAGNYIFSEPEGVFTVAHRLISADFGFAPIRLTVPEGTPSFDIPTLVAKELADFDATLFVKLAEKREGYLFPDSYLVYPNTTAEELVNLMETTFTKKVSEHAADIKASGKSLDDIIIMASIIEREVKKPEDKRLVSGILWKRLKIGMPLQVDAPFAYISDKSTHELTKNDLKQDSPYNTYNRLGLPPTPIGNPGLDSILAAIEPKDSSYLYYLSDKRGNIHYAVTFEEHKQNKFLYIK